MRQNDLIDAQRIVGLIEAGTASRSDMVALFIYLREQLDNRDPVKDIAHCIAHSVRDRGIAFRYIEAFVRDFINWAHNGGALHVNILFPLEEVMERLIQDLENQGVTVQPDSFRQQSVLFRRHIGDILEGVEISLSNPNVVACSFATADNNPVPHFLVRFHGLESRSSNRKKPISSSFSSSMSAGNIPKWHYLTGSLENARVIQTPPTVAMAFPVLSSS